MTFKEKAENYWFYYKIHTIAGIFVLAFIAITVVQCVQNIDPDLSIAYVSSVYRDTDALEKAITEAVGDLNGDGSVYSYCENITIPKEPTSEADMMMGQKLMLMFVSGENRLYIMEKEYFQTEMYSEMFEDLNGIVDSELLERGVRFGGRDIAVDTLDCPYLKNLGIANEGLYVGVVRISETDRKSKNIDARYAKSVKLLEMFLE